MHQQGTASACRRPYHRGPTAISDVWVLTGVHSVVTGSPVSALSRTLIAERDRSAGGAARVTALQFCSGPWPADVPICIGPNWPICVSPLACRRVRASRYSAGSGDAGSVSMPRGWPLRVNLPSRDWPGPMPHVAVAGAVDMLLIVGGLLGGLL